MGTAVSNLFQLRIVAQTRGSAPSWVMTTPLNTWTTIPGTNWCNDIPVQPYINGGFITQRPRAGGGMVPGGTWGGLQSYGGLAFDRDTATFYSGASGGGAGAFAANGIDAWKCGLEVPTMAVIVPPDHGSAMWTKAEANASNVRSYGGGFPFSKSPFTSSPPPGFIPADSQKRPNTGHTGKQLVFSKLAQSVLKFSTSQTWEFDAGAQGGTVWQARLARGNWDPWGTVPSIVPSLAAVEDWSGWRIEDHATGDIYVANGPDILKYTYIAGVWTKTLWATDSTQSSLSRANAVIDPVNRIMLLMMQSRVDASDPLGPMCYEIDLASGAFSTVFRLTGPQALKFPPAQAIFGLDWDPNGARALAYFDDGPIYTLTRNGVRHWYADKFTLAGTAPDNALAGTARGSPGAAAIYNTFRYSPLLRGIVYFQCCQRDIYYVRLHS